RLPVNYLAADSKWRDAFNFIGAPMVSMLIAVLVSCVTFGYRRGFSSADILKFSNDCMTPIAATLLVVGAGGGFNQILRDCKVGIAIKDYASGFQLPTLVLGWVITSLIRIAVGSSTVAITTAVGIVGPLATSKGVNLELLAVAMGAGSLMLSHVNDG